MKKNHFQYTYWQNIIDGKESVTIDTTEVSSQVLLDHWKYIFNYYYVIKEEVKAERMEKRFKEADIIHNLTYTQNLTKSLYKKNLEIVKNKIIDFFTTILKNSDKLRKSEASVPLKVISIVYSLDDNSEFYLCAQPSSTFYADKLATYVKEFQLRHEFEIDIYKIESEIYNEFNITVGEYSDEYTNYTYDLFSQLLFDCWKVAKKNTDSPILGTLEYGSGGIDYDLDTGESIHFHIEDHYKNKGIFIEKDVDL
ncbi:hypothetical protein [Kordia sp.]|uniref:hypothetical protein n=1 Tax=Kordia sp. TaxID=1965332 RepID=UPI0038661052